MVYHRMVVVVTTTTELLKINFKCFSIGKRTGWVSMIFVSVLSKSAMASSNVPKSEAFSSG